MLAGKGEQSYVKGALPAVELDDDLARAVIVYFFELANVAC